MNLSLKKIIIGELILARVSELSIENARIAKALNISEKEIKDIYESEDISAVLLLKFSKFLEYDFFRVYSQHMLIYSPPSNFVRSCSLPQFRKNIYTKEIIEFIIELVETNEKSKKQIIDEYRIPKVTLYNWLRKYKK